MRKRDSKAERAPRTPQPKKANGAFSSCDLYFILQRANLEISRQLDDELRPLGLTSRQSIILSAIAEQVTLRQAALADRLGKDRTTVTANLGPLIRRGLVVSARNPDDRRAQTIALTPDGDRLLDQARGHLRRFNTELCARVESRGGTKQLRAVLETLSQRQRSGSLSEPSDQT